jgi:hypothetical protein
LQVQSPEFKPQSHQKKTEKKGRMMYVFRYHMNWKSSVSLFLLNNDGMKEIWLDYHEQWGLKLCIFKIQQQFRQAYL